MNKNYPIHYKVMSRQSLIQQTPDKDTVIILIHGNIATDLDEPVSFNKVIPLLPQYADYKLFAIDDVNVSDLDHNDIKQYHPYFITNKTINDIDSFLKKHQDKKVIISCVAGVSRSGAVGWYLDQIQNKTEKWSYEEYGDGLKRPISKFLFPHRDMYLKFKAKLNNQ